MKQLRFVVGIATTGRRETLSHAIRRLALQERLPDLLIVSPAKPEDCDEAMLAEMPFATKVVRGPIGSTYQRNTILEACDDADVVAFFDDDFYADPRYLREAEQLLLANPDIVGITGLPLADGAVTAGVSHDEALALLAANEHQSRPSQPYEIYNLYGCNMVARLDAVRRSQLRFDPDLPLYAWLEDVDFSRRLASHGRLVKLDTMNGVHLAVKRGRTSGVRFGYSQVANPIYLMRKGTMEPRRALLHVARNVARNLQRSLFPEPWIDRRGRVRGNLMAANDLLRRRMRPDKIVELK